MRIGIIWKNDYPWDVRVEKIALALRDDGHAVHILCANAGGRVREESIEGLHIHRLPATRKRWMNRMISTPFYLNPFWFRLASNVIVRERLDLLIVRDLPLITVGMWFKRRLRMPVILDMAENYPAMYREGLGTGGIRSWMRWVIKNPRLMELIERRALQAVDHTLVVVEESANRIVGMGVPEEKVTVVSNTPRLDGFVPGQASKHAEREEGAALRLVYTGFVQEGRGLEVAVQALQILRDRREDVRMQIVGDGQFLRRLVELVQINGLQDVIEFTGWVTHEKVAWYVSNADVGVIPHPKNEHTDSTVPNKLFDYMACGKPVVVSDAAPLKRIVEGEGCGVVFVAGNAQSLADAIASLRGSVSGREAMGQSGIRAVTRRFNWEWDAKALAAALARFEPRTSS